MKRVLAISLVLILLTGCAKQTKELDRVLRLRTKLQKAESCSFSAKITADYGENIYTFALDCVVDGQGNMTFTVAQPETIEGITGTVDADGGKITFDDKVLAFQTIADDQITPVSAPWLAVKTLRGGYLTAAGSNDQQLFAVINDSYQEQALELEFWFDEADLPKSCEILWLGTRILSLEVEDFVIL